MTDHLHGLSGAGIVALPSGALRDLKLAKPEQEHLLAHSCRPVDQVEDAVGVGASDLMLRS